MIKIIITFFLLTLAIDAQEVFPTFKLKSVGFVNDFVVDANHLYAANDEGVVDIFNLKSKKIINQIILPPLTTNMGKLIAANILSVDSLNGKVLIVSVGRDAYRNVWIYENNKLKQIVNEEKKLTIKEARFLNNNQIIFATLDSEIILHDTQERYNIYKTHISQSTLGDMVLSDDKTEIVIADESGSVKIIDAMSSKVKKKYSSQNVDNIYHIAYSNGVVLTAGQDRRMAVYHDKIEPYYFQNNFLVYCVALSPKGKVGIYTSNEKNHLQLFNPKTKELKDILIGHDTPVNQIQFINEKELFSSDGRENIFYWKL